MERGIRKRNVISEMYFGTYFLMFAMIVAIGLISMMYLMQFTDIHTKGYSLRRLEGERDRLKTTQEIKYTNVSRVRSLSHIQQTEQVKRMVPATNVVYLKPDTAIVQK